MRNGKFYGCPAYIFDPRFPDGKKISNWEPRNIFEKYIENSSKYSSSISLTRDLGNSNKFILIKEDMMVVILSVIMFGMFLSKGLILLERINIDQDHIPLLHTDRLTSQDICTRTYKDIDKEVRYRVQKWKYTQGQSKKCIHLML